PRGSTLSLPDALPIWTPVGHLERRVESQIGGMGHGTSSPVGAPRTVPTRCPRRYLWATRDGWTSRSGGSGTADPNPPAPTSRRTPVYIGLGTLLLVIILIIILT